MKQVVKIFYYGSTSPATSMNEFLKENPNHSVYKIVPYGKSMLDFLVVFNVEEEQFRTHE
jgi:hypothetical protein